MKHYKSPNNELYAYELDGSQDHLIPEDFVLVTDAEAAQLRTLSEARALGALDYAERRRMEYPPIGEYLDGVVKGDQAQIAAYIAACLAVKAKFPKP